MMNIRASLRIFGFENSEKSDYNMLQFVGAFLSYWLAETYVTNSKDDIHSKGIGIFLIAFLNFGIFKFANLVHFTTARAGIESIVWVSIGTLAIYKLFQVRKKMIDEYLHQVQHNFEL